MGCCQSKIEIEIKNKESVCRCKDRLHFLEDVAAARNMFACYHSLYAMSLKDIGAALNDYVQGLAHHTPPPPTNLSEEEEEEPHHQNNHHQVEPKTPEKVKMEEEEEEEEVVVEEEEERHHQNHHIHHHQVQPNTPEKVKMEGFTTEEEETPVMMAMKDKQFMHSNTAPIDDSGISDGGAVNGGGGGMVGGSSSVNLLKIFDEIDDHFLKAFESAQEVSKMLDATWWHNLSNFEDNRGHINHAARVMRVKGVPGEDGNDEYDETMLNKLLALEKKLYEEVKAGEIMKLQYQRKVALLNKLKKRGVSNKSLEKTKAVARHLLTRYNVGMQSLNSTLSEVICIHDIHDKQLYPKLVALVDGMANMWQSMSYHYRGQLSTVTYLKSLEVSGAPKETTRLQQDMTFELYRRVKWLHSDFEKKVTHEKRYIQALNNGLNLNLIPIISSLKENILSPPTIQTLPIQTLLHSWYDHLQKFPDELVKSAISSFAAGIKIIKNHQKEEMKLKDKWEKTRKEYLRKNQAFKDWYQKYIMRRGPQDETGVTGTDPKDPIAKRQLVVESLRKRLDDEMEAHQKLCMQVRDKTLENLMIQLPELFRAMSDYAQVCCDSYQRLRLVIRSQNRQNGSLVMVL